MEERDHSSEMWSGNDPLLSQATLWHSPRLSVDTDLGEDQPNVDFSETVNASFSPHWYYLSGENQHDPQLNEICEDESMNEGVSQSNDLHQLEPAQTQLQGQEPILLESVYLQPIPPKPVYLTPIQPKPVYQVAPTEATLQAVTATSQTSDTESSSLRSDVPKERKRKKAGPKRKKLEGNEGDVAITTAGPSRRTKRLQSLPLGQDKKRKNEGGSFRPCVNLSRDDVKRQAEADGFSVRNYQRITAVKISKSALVTYQNSADWSVPQHLAEEVNIYLRRNFGVVWSSFYMLGNVPVRDEKEEEDTVDRKVILLQDCFSLRRSFKDALGRILGTDNLPLYISKIPKELRKELLKDRKNRPGYNYPMIKCLTEQKMKDDGWSEHKRRHCEHFACERSLKMALITRSFLSKKAAEFVDEQVGLKHYWKAFLVNSLPLISAEEGIVQGTQTKSVVHDGNL